MKLFALSDIHGRAFSLSQFEALGFDVNDPNHHIVLLGDYFDRYDKNQEVFDEIMKMKSILNERLHLLKGNHDEFMEQFIAHVMEQDLGGALSVDSEISDRWLRNGGAITLEQCLHITDLKGIYTEAIKARLQMYGEFIASLKPYVMFGNHIFTHASIDSEFNCDYWNRDLIQSKNPFDDKTIVVGHSPFRYCMEFESLEIVPSKSMIGLMVQHKTLDNQVYIIDNGEGNNIVMFQLKTPRKRLEMSQYPYA